MERHHERVIVTRNGRPAAVLVSPEALESLEETLALLSDAETLGEPAEAERDIEEGKGVRGVEAVLALRRG